MCRARWSDLEKHLQGQNRNKEVRFCLLDCVTDQIHTSLNNSSESWPILLGTGNPKGEEYKHKRYSRNSVEVPEVPWQSLSF